MSKKKIEKTDKNNPQRYNLGEFTLGVKVPHGDTPEAKKYALEGALRQFKKIVTEAGVLDEYKARREFIKPSAKKREKRQQAIRRNKHQQRLLNNMDY